MTFVDLGFHIARCFAICETFRSWVSLRVTLPQALARARGAKFRIWLWVTSHEDLHSTSERVDLPCPQYDFFSASCVCWRRSCWPAISLL